MRAGFKKWAKLLGVLAVAVIATTACVAGADQEKEFLAKANAGDAEAQYQLSRLYFEGNGVDHSDKKGEHWVRKSAEQGFAQAQNDLGMMYLSGIVVRKNAIEADKWLTLASRQGYGPGTRTMKDLEDTMQPDQIKQAKTMADEWKPSSASAK